METLSNEIGLLSSVYRKNVVWNFLENGELVDVKTTSYRSEDKGRKYTRFECDFTSSSLVSSVI